MDRFKLPRKTKKALKKGMWLYPPDEQGNSLMARPARSEKDYQAYKKGILRNLIERRASKKKEFRERLDVKISVSDETLRSYVNDIITENYRSSSYDILIKAKNSKHAIIAYYNFINAYQLYEKGEESYGNICCMSIDVARDRLRQKKGKSKKK